MTRRTVLWLSGSLLLAACGDWNGGDRQGWSLLPPVALSSRLAYVETSNARVFLLDPADPALAARQVDVRKDPVLAVRRNGKDELLVLSRGDRGGPGVAAEPAELTIVPADPSRAPTRLALGSRFNALAQSSDGRFVIVHFGRGTPAGEVLFNPNEIAIVDLDAATVVPKTIRSFGGVPTGMVFSDEPLWGGGGRLAVIFSDGYVTLVDLDKARTASETTVPLDDRQTVKPAQAVFQPGQIGGDTPPTIFVRADNADDVYALALKPGDATSNGNDFRPVLSLLMGGSRPADMALFAGDDGPRLLVVSASGDAFVIDARTSRSTRVPLGAAATGIRLFHGAAPGEPKDAPRALLLGPGADLRFLDLDRLEDQRARNLDSRPMSAPAAELLLLPDQHRAIVLHRGGGAGAAGMSVVDLERRTVAPIIAGVPLVRAVPGPAGTDRIWLPPANGVELPFLTVSSLETSSVRLDAPIEAVLPIGKHIVVVHPAAAGHVTVLDAAKPERATARSTAGFLLAGLLERGDK